MLDTVHGTPTPVLGYLTPSEFAAANAIAQPMEKTTHEATLRVTVEDLPSGRHLTHPPMSEAMDVGADEAGAITRLS